MKKSDSKDPLKHAESQPSDYKDPLEHAASQPKETVSIKPKQPTPEEAKLRLIDLSKKFAPEDEDSDFTKYIKKNLRDAFLSKKDPYYALIEAKKNLMLDLYQRDPDVFHYVSKNYQDDIVAKWNEKSVLRVMLYDDIFNHESIKTENDKSGLDLWKKYEDAVDIYNEAYKVAQNTKTYENNKAITSEMRAVIADVRANPSQKPPSEESREQYSPPRAYA